MTKSSSRKVATEKTRGLRRKTAAKAAAAKLRDPDGKIAPGAEQSRNAHSKTGPRPASEQVRSAHSKTGPGPATEQVRSAHSNTASGPAAEQVRNAHSKTGPGRAAEQVRHSDHKPTQSEEFRAMQVPHSMSALAKNSIAKTRKLYERSQNSLQALFQSWERALEGGMALNRKIIDITHRNIGTGFDLAANLAGAKNLAEVTELQAVYWRKQFGDLNAQIEEVQTLATNVRNNVMEPLKNGEE